MSPCHCNPDSSEAPHDNCSCKNDKLKKTKKQCDSIICSTCQERQQPCKLCQILDRSKRTLDKKQSMPKCGRCGREISRELKCDLCGEDFAKHVKIKVSKSSSYKDVKNKSQPAPYYSGRDLKFKEKCNICGKKTAPKPLKCCDKEQSTTNTCCKDEEKRINKTPSQFPSQTSCCVAMTRKDEMPQLKRKRPAKDPCFICGKVSKEAEPKCEICGKEYGMDEPKYNKVGIKYSQMDNNCSICGKEFIKDSGYMTPSDTEMDDGKCAICSKDMYKICDHCGKDLPEVQRCIFCGKDS